MILRYIYIYFITDLELFVFLEKTLQHPYYSKQQQQKKNDLPSERKIQTIVGAVLDHPSAI
jgi:hypothetical protein